MGILTEIARSGRGLIRRACLYHQSDLYVGDRSADRCDEYQNYDGDERYSRNPLLRSVILPIGVVG